MFGSSPIPMVFSLSVRLSNHNCSDFVLFYPSLCSQIRIDLLLTFLGFHHYKWWNISNICLKTISEGLKLFSMFFDAHWFNHVYNCHRWIICIIGLPGKIIRTEEYLTGLTPGKLGNWICESLDKNAHCRTISVEQSN